MVDSCESDRDEPDTFMVSYGEHGEESSLLEL